MTRNGWAAPCFVVLAAAVAGSLFAPVFGLVPLLVPVGATALVALAVALLCSRTASLRPWRPLLVAVAGLLAIVETVLPGTTVAGVPTAGTARELVAGAGGSWRATLQSTWPARPDAELVLFVPLLVLLAVVLGVELLHRVDAPLWSLVPSAAVLVLSQLFVPLDPVPALIAGLAYAAAAGGVLATSRGQDGRGFAAAGLVVPIVIGLVCAAFAGLVVPPPVSDYSLQHDQQVPLEPQQVESPLGKLADWHLDPEAPLFEVRGAGTVDRWPLVVLDSFNGVTWFPGNQYRRLGSELPPPEEMRRPADLRSARITLLDEEELGGPWLPGQPAPAGVRGPRVLVDQRRGTLLRSEGGATAYEVSWWEPRIDSLRDAAVDADAPGGLAPLGAVPAGVAELSDEAMGGLRPTFQAALVLERWMRENYQVAVGPDVPTGHGWPQLSEFLLRTKRGTSEQFAASYVALARASGIPARLVVGFRGPAHADGVVRGGDALAWPEVAVADVGWVSLDPTGAARETDAADSGGPASPTDRAREQLPPAQDLLPPPVAPSDDRAAEEQRDAASVPWTALLAVPAVLALLWIAGAPLWGLLRSGLRRRRGVEGAMDEVRDLLRACGLPVTAGMTAKDLAVAASGHVDRATEGALRELGLVVDLALWTPPWHVRDDVAALAWTAVRSVRRGVVRRGAMTWLRVTWRPLRSPR